MKLRRIIYLGGAMFLTLVVFTIDVIDKNVELDVAGVDLLRNLMVIGTFVLIYFFFQTVALRREESPTKKLGLALIATIVMVLSALGLSLGAEAGFDSKNFSLIPLDYATLFLASLLSMAFGLFCALVLTLLRDLLLFKRKRGTQRNLFIFFLLMLATAGSTLTMRPLESSILTSILFGATILFGVINAFRLSWIVYLTKREKIFSLIYGFFLFLGFVGLNVLLGQSSMVNRSLLYYSYPLQQFVSIVCLFGNIYFGMAFISTLFHLPTAEAFDRKTSEVSSLHNLSRLVTQVFDFNELVDTVTTMTLQVCEARSCWLEIIHTSEEDARLEARPQDIVAYSSSIGNYHVQVVGSKNIGMGEIDGLVSPSERTLRDIVLMERRPIIVDDVKQDPRFQHLKKTKHPVGSLAVVPLVSHTGLIGILYVTKETEFGFFKDDIAVISAFADQASVAIENSRLIKKSIERERLIREMMVAQEMQRRLLPQTLPKIATLELDAVSTPAFEVGGDYYDFVQLDKSKLGIIVGDVSGKGVSAAFYMSEVKGIFQSLSRLYPSPKDFMVKANEALSGSIDKHSFISLIYAVVDTTTGTLVLARAGHCPLLHVSGETVQYLRPTGMGLGLSQGPAFSDSIEEKSIALKNSDLCVFYTDGVTEARRGDDEFGYDRLLDTVLQSKGKSATEVKDNIIETVRAHTNHGANEDDLTVVVLKWCGDRPTGTKVFSQLEEAR